MFQLKPFSLESLNAASRPEQPGCKSSYPSPGITEHRGPKQAFTTSCLERCVPLLHPSHVSAVSRHPWGSSKYSQQQLCSPTARNTTVRKARFVFMLPAAAGATGQTAVPLPKTFTTSTPDLPILMAKFSINGGSIAVFRDFFRAARYSPSDCDLWGVVLDYIL